VVGIPGNSRLMTEKPSRMRVGSEFEEWKGSKLRVGASEASH